MPSIAAFNNEFRVLMMDPDITGRTFTDGDISVFREKSMRYLYKKKIAKEVANFFGTYTDMTLLDTTTIDFAMPTNWQRITAVAFWENITTTWPMGNSQTWDDRVRAGYIRVFDAPDWSGYRLHLTGLKNWTGVDDSTMPDAVYDVVMTASQVFAVQAFANKRAAQRRNISSQEVTLASEGLWYARLVNQLRQDVREARKVMRPIG